MNQLKGVLFPVFDVLFPVTAVMRHERTELIRQFIISELIRESKTVRKDVCDRFGLTRQAANRHLRSLVEDGILAAEGATSARTYRLIAEQVVYETRPTNGLQEDLVWSKYVAPHFLSERSNVRDVFLYGFTEILNNAIDHSRSVDVKFTMIRTAGSITLTVCDQGVGVFNNLQNTYGFQSPHEAILELVKGKLTTDPHRHSGQGIFFTSRMMDVFTITSGETLFRHLRSDEKWIAETTDDEVQGTIVEMTLRRDSHVESTEIFDRFAHPEKDDYSFSRTHVPIILAEFDDRLVSRSQAKRVLRRIDEFKEVVFDFANVDFIGQAFADEIFRVYANDHPQIELNYRNANPRVAGMIQRARTNDAPGQKTLFDES